MTSPWLPPPPMRQASEARTAPGLQDESTTHNSLSWLRDFIMSFAVWPLLFPPVRAALPPHCISIAMDAIGAALRAYVRRCAHRLKVQERMVRSPLHVICQVCLLVCPMLCALMSLGLVRLELSLLFKLSVAHRPRLASL